MTVVGVAVVPAAPLLLADIRPTLPAGLAAVRACMQQVLRALPPADVSLLLVGTPGPGPVVAAPAGVDFAALGRPDVRFSRVAGREVAERVAATFDQDTFAQDLDADVPIDASVLAGHAPATTPVVAVAAPRAAPFGVLSSAGARVASTLEDARLAVIAAGDLAAGLTARAPLALVHGSNEWDARAVQAVRAGRWDDLEALGPQDAQRVGARAWPALAVLAGLLTHADLRLEVDMYVAPRGVGYLVAHA